MKYITLILFFVFLFNTACFAEPYFTKQVLPSGQELKVIALAKISFKDGPPALGLKYETDLDIKNKQLLREEAEKIWPFFRPTVEKHGMTNAALIASEPRKYTGPTYTVNNFTFVVKSKKNGTWAPYSWGRDYEKESATLAEKYLKELQANNLSATFKFIHNPEEYSKKQLDGLVGMLTIVTQELGNISSYSLNDEQTIVNYEFTGIQSAFNDYWIKFPTFFSSIYDVRFENVGKGYIVFNFSIVKDNMVINSVHYSLPSERNDAKSIMEKIGNRIGAEVFNNPELKEKT